MNAACANKYPANSRFSGLSFGLGPLFFLLPLFALADVVVPIDAVENHVNIRMSAASDAEIVGRLRQGDALPLVSSVTDWHEVEIAGGATGFISADWTKVLDEAPQAEAVVVNDEANDATDESAETVSGPTVAATAASSDEEPVAATNDSESEVVTEVAETDLVNDATPESGAIEPTSGQTETLEEIQLAVRKIPSQAIGQPDAPPVDASIVNVDTETAADAVSQVDAEEAVVQARAETLPVVKGATTPGTISTVSTQGEQGLQGVMGPAGPPGPPGPPGAATIEGSPDFLMKFAAPTIGANSQVYDDGNNIGIGTTEPKQRLEVNGNIQIHERNSSVAGLMITQASGDTGYIMHNQASTLTIGAGSIDRITINRDGNVGLGVNRPAHPMEMASGAYVSAGGVWTNSSSRQRKENIVGLDAGEAMAALAQLQPVEFNYKNDQQEKYIGFIAEDVPDLVATVDRQSLSTMDIVAVLTKVVQEQQLKIAALEAKLEQR